MLQQTSDTMPRARGWLLVAVIALAGVMPYRVVASSHPVQTADKSATAHADTTTPPPLAVPAAPKAPAAPAVPPAPPVPAIPPAPPVPAVPAVPPVPPVPPEFGAHGRNVFIYTTPDTHQGFALLDGDSVTIRGTRADVAAVKHLHRSGQPMLWYRTGDQAYLVRDKATIEQAREIYAPVFRLARQQGQLAGQQGRIAGQQAGLAARKAAFAQRQAALAQRQARLAQQQARWASGTRANTREQALAAQKRAMHEARARLSRDRAARERKTAARRQAWKTQHDKLAGQQKALAQRQQEASRKAVQAMHQLIEQAAARGLAKRVDAG